MLTLEFLRMAYDEMCFDNGMTPDPEAFPLIIDAPHTEYTEQDLIQCDEELKFIHNTIPNGVCIVSTGEYLSDNRVSNGYDKNDPQYVEIQLSQKLNDLLDFIFERI